MVKAYGNLCFIASINLFKMLKIQKAERKQKKLRMALAGVSGSGKTRSALEIASGLGKKILLLDSERDSASMYGDLIDFDSTALPNPKVETYLDGIKAGSDYEVLIIDSLSHAWQHILDEHGKATDASAKKDSYAMWRFFTPIYQRLIDGILRADCHVIATMRSKVDYLRTENNGKTEFTKAGLAPIMREGIEYEFDIYGQLSVGRHILTIEKSRIDFLQGQLIEKPGKELGESILNWLNGGAVQKEVFIYKLQSDHKSLKDRPITDFSESKRKQMVVDFAHLLTEEDLKQLKGDENGV